MNESPLSQQQLDMIQSMIAAAVKEAIESLEITVDVRKVDRIHIILSNPEGKISSDYFYKS